MNKRLHELDSLRGIAALTVMFSHLMLVFPLVWNTTSPEGTSLWIKAFFFSPLRIAWAGHEAVIFFFVLSGFVLSLPLWSKDRPLANYTSYLTKRVLRIYPPYLVSAILAIAACHFWGGHVVPNVSDWFNQSWQTPVTTTAVIDHALMIGSFNNCDYNPVLWSLVHEMRISIVFPLVIFALRKWEKAFWLLPFAFSATDWLSVSLRHKNLINFEHDYFNTLHYLGFFIVGALLAKYTPALMHGAASLSRFSKVVWGLCAVAVYTNAFWLPVQINRISYSFGKLFSKPWTQDWITCAGVVTFIMIALSTGRMSRLLASRILLFLGAISYSLYLIHALILKSLATLLSSHLRLEIIVIACAMLAIPAAWLCWNLVERPTIYLGQKLSKFLQERSI